MRDQLAFVERYPLPTIIIPVGLELELVWMKSGESPWLQAVLRHFGATLDEAVSFEAR